jgi:hypothetical protein
MDSLRHTPILQPTFFPEHSEAQWLPHLKSALASKIQKQHNVFVYVSYDSYKKQRLYIQTALTVWSLP